MDVDLRSLLKGFLLEKKVEGLSPQTIDYYLDKLGNFLWYCEQNGLVLHQIDANAIREFLAYLRESKHRWCQGVVLALEQLPPTDQNVAVTLIRQLAERNGIRVIVETAWLDDLLDALPLWRAQMRQEGRSPITIQVYEQSIRQYLRSDPAPTTQSIRQNLARRLDEVSEAKVSTEHKALKSYFATLYEAGLWPTNPVNGVKPIRIPRRERPCPTEEDVLKLLHGRCFHENHTPKFIVMVTILATMGLRITEACSIKTADINWDANEVRIIGKGNKERFVPLQPVTRALIAQYLQCYPNNSEWLFPADNQLGY